MLPRIRTVKIAAIISAIYFFVRILFWSWSISAAVLNQAPNCETKQILSYATW